MAIKIRMPLVFKEIMESACPYDILYGGRLGGKSNNTAIVAILTQLANPYTDVVVARVSYGSLADSSYAELESTLDSMGENIREEYELKKSPLRMERKGGSGVIYFIGYGGSNTSRTKSIKTKHPISVIILEETQELKDKRNLEEALASFRRRFDNQVKVFILGNNPPQEAHWFNKYINEKRFDPDFLVKNVTYLDILPFINDYDLKEILKTKLIDEQYYRWFYLGETTGGFGAVYPMFKHDKHVISSHQWDMIHERYPSLKPVAVIIGGDGAVNNDSTAFVAWILLNNGQAIAAPIFYHNPVDDGVCGYHQLVQDKLIYWVEDICRQFHLGSITEIRTHPTMKRIPIWMYIDSAAPDLIQECRFFMSDRISVNPVKKDNVPQMVSTVQSAIMNENLIIIDYGGYYNYTKRRWIKRNTNLLEEQWSMLIWNERQDNYDPIVPNDVSDAATYGAISWFKNTENIQFFNIQKLMGRGFKKISDILNEKE